jgi:hypothetical protein
MNFKPKVTPKSILNNIKRGILEEIKSKIDEVKGAEEIYFHDIVHGVIDRNTPTNIKLCSEIIADFDMEESHIDEGLIDKSSTSRIMITTAYVVLENELFKDDFFVDYLQNKLNNEVVTRGEGFKIVEEIDDYIKEHKLNPQTFEDNDVQIHIIVGEEIKIDDFKEPFFNKTQMIDLHDGIKILANNHETNKNAVVLEKLGKTKEGFRYRVYLMDKSKDINIKDLMIQYAENTIGSHNGYNLDPRTYIDSPCTHFPDKKKLIYTLNQMVNGEEGLIVLGDKEHESKK